VSFRWRIVTAAAVMTKPSPVPWMAMLFRSAAAAPRCQALGHLYGAGRVVGAVADHQGVPVGHQAAVDGVLDVFRLEVGGIATVRGRGGVVVHDERILGAGVQWLHKPRERARTMASAAVNAAIPLVRVHFMSISSLSRYAQISPLLAQAG